jgi:hypothetical protein
MWMGLVTNRPERGAAFALACIDTYLPPKMGMGLICRTRTTVPSRISRTIGSSASSMAMVVDWENVNRKAFAFLPLASIRLMRRKKFAIPLNASRQTLRASENGSFELAAGQKRPQGYYLDEHAPPIVDFAIRREREVGRTLSGSAR